MDLKDMTDDDLRARKIGLEKEVGQLKTDSLAAGATRFISKTEWATYQVKRSALIEDIRSIDLEFVRRRSKRSRDNLIKTALEVRDFLIDELDPDPDVLALIIRLNDALGEAGVKIRKGREVQHGG